MYIRTNVFVFNKINREIIVVSHDECGVSALFGGFGKLHYDNPVVLLAETHIDIGIGYRRRNIPKIGPHQHIRMHHIRIFFYAVRKNYVDRNGTFRNALKHRIKLVLKRVWHH